MRRTNRDSITERFARSSLFLHQHLIPFFALLVAMWIMVPSSEVLRAEMAAENTMKPQDIADAIEDEILFDRAVSLNNIQIAVVDGVVTLTGSADNMLEKDRAVRIAETIKGVRSVIDRIEVKPYWGRTDRDSEQDAIAALARDPATDPREVNVKVSHGAATLTGTVDSWQEKHLAEQVIKGVRGVASITNNIEIDYASDRSDAEIKPEIERILRHDVLVDDGLISVAVKDGAVRLTGAVGSAAERRQAGNDAWVASVTEVDISGLNVETWARDERMRKDKYVRLSDEQIRGAIESALHYDPRVPSAEVAPEVDNAQVTLRGEVANLKAKWAAAQDARNTVGVTRVANRIRVQLSALPAQEIESNIASAFSSDPYLERHDLSVSVMNGTAYLSGTVDSYYEKGHAEDVASRVPGVTEVYNNLIVSQDYPLAYNPYVFDYYPYDNDWYDYEPYTTFRTDAEIRDDIISQLWWSPFVDPEQIKVKVEQGVATLTGSVDTFAERAAATENAYEGGAVWVDNELLVRAK